MFFLQVLSILFFAIAALLVYSAGLIVKRFKLDEKVECGFEHSMDEGELAEYKYRKALVRVKMIGMVLAIPAIIMIFLVFK